MRVLIVSQYYDPEPVYIPATVAKGLAERGHQVTVVTGFPNYPHGKVYKGYRQRLWLREHEGSVAVVRTALWASHSKNPLGRLANYLSFALSSLVAVFAARQIDVVYVYAAQMTASLGPSVRRSFGGIPFVLHIQDLWPESVTGSSMLGGGRVSSFIGGALRPWLKSTYRQASATIAIAPTMARMLVARGVPSSKIRMIYNWANEGAADGGSAISHVAGQPFAPDRNVRVVYAGNLGDHQDLETVLLAAKMVESEKLSFEIYGAGMAQQGLHELADQLGVRNVVFRGSVDSAAMKLVYSNSDFQLVTLKDREIFRGTIPSKLQACLFNGSAVMTNVAGDVAELCEQEDFGFTCAPGSVESMAEMFRQAARTSPECRRRMAENGRRYYSRRMSLSQGLDALEGIMVEASNDRKKKR